MNAEATNVRALVDNGRDSVRLQEAYDAMRSGTRPMAYEDMRRYFKTVRSVDQPVVDGLIFQRRTLISGDAEAGKSMFATLLALAFVGGDTHFLGRRIHRPGLSVLYVVTDADSEAEIYERVEKLAPGQEFGGRLCILTAPADFDDNERWSELSQHSKSFDVAIFDNILGANGTGRDTNSNNEVAYLESRFKLLQPKVLPIWIHHATYVQGQGFKPAGSRQFKARFRDRISVDKLASGTRLKLNGHGETDGLSVMLNRDPDTGVLTPLDGREIQLERKQKQDRTDTSLICRELAELADTKQMNRKHLATEIVARKIRGTEGSAEGFIRTDLIDAGWLTATGHNQPLKAGPLLTAD